MTSIQAVEGNMRLMVPSPKVVQRLQRVVLAAIAAKLEVSFLSLEERFHLTRSALVHLCYHTSFKSELGAKVEKFTEASWRFLRDPKTDKMLPRNQLLEPMRLTTQVEGLAEYIRSQESLTKEHLQQFIDTSDALQEAYLAEGCDPMLVIDPVIYTQAMMIVANFGAYDRTLNEK